MDDTLLHVSEIFPTYALTPAALTAFCVFAERKNVYEIPCSCASPLLRGKPRCAHGGKKPIYSKYMEVYFLVMSAMLHP